jgi:hypothetical protein
MTRHEEAIRVPASPAGEEIHLPAASPLPLITGIALAATLVSSTFSVLLSAVGGVVFALCAIRWARETRSSTAALPEPASAE